LPRDPRTPRKRQQRWAAAFVTVAAIAIAIVVMTSSHSHKWPEAVRPATFVGDSTCLSCHGEKASFEGTAHRITTQSPSRATILGSFTSGENVLRNANSDLHFRMDADSTGFYQTAVFAHGADSTSRRERIAIVAGSGRGGQSYLYWKGDRLYQLPVSYWSSNHRWINSPGPAYIEGQANFARGVAPRCLECHATWIEAVPDLSHENTFQAQGAILGITCERCHGEGKTHVATEQSPLHSLHSPQIVNPAHLTRERQMEACAQCHGGLGTPKIPSFTYVAGQRLDNYVDLPVPGPNETVDVHGNKVALLERSRCFRESKMTCTTCHDVHRTQRDTTALSGRCLTCHQEQSCGLFATRGRAAVAGRCVTCHMPEQSSNLIVSALEGEKKQAQMRNHWIKVYPETANR